MAKAITESIVGTVLPHLQDVAVAPVASQRPTGFPGAVDSDLAWVGGQFHQHSEFICSLDDDDLKEIAAALKEFKALELDGDSVSRDTFPLPGLGPKLEQIRWEVHNGRGFSVIRGVDPEHYSVGDLTIIYLGIQSYIASRPGRQDKKGNMLVHIVADNSSKATSDHHRHSTAPITFHTEESGDVVSWLTRSTAASGGKCIIASAYTVYNVLVSTRPDLIRVLARSDWPFALPEFHCRPILFHHGGRLIFNFGRVALLGSRSHPRPAHLPVLSPRQWEALEAVEEVSKATQLEIATRPGDIHFINNLAILHRRGGFVNGQESDKKRHLVRMRLRDDKLGWDIPAELTGEWRKAFDETGIGRVWHPEPMPEGFFPLRSYPN